MNHQNTETAPIWLETIPNWEKDSASWQMSDLSRTTVLLIDDDSDQLLFLKTLIEKGGYSVVTASDVETGLAILHTVRISCVICDMVMPNANGLVFVKKLRELAFLTPVIMISANNKELERSLNSNEVLFTCDKRKARERLLPLINFTLT